MQQLGKDYLVMVLPAAGAALEAERRPLPEPVAGEVLVKVRACAVCRTDLHLYDGELPDIRYPIVPGHEVVGEVIAAGSSVDLAPGLRVGIPWLAGACGRCRECRAGRENLCDQARFTGYHRDGGYAEYLLADAAYVFELPERYDDLHAAPLLCAGLIGYRAYKMAGEEAEHIGIYGFGAAAHIITQVAVARGRSIYAFTRPGDEKAQHFARHLGAVWAGGAGETPPHVLDAALIFAPLGELVPAALAAVRKGGTVVCGGIHMSDIPSFPYRLLWGERVIRSVANLTRADGREFMQLAANIGIATHTECLPLTAANEALDRLRRGAVEGALVLVPGESSSPR